MDEPSTVVTRRVRPGQRTLSYLPGDLLASVTSYKWPPIGLDWHCLQVPDVFSMRTEFK